MTESLGEWCWNIEAKMNIKREGNVTLAKRRKWREAEAHDAWDKGMGKYFASVLRLIPKEWNI